MPDMEQFAGKVVVVTGASRGIGALLTRRLAKANAKVVFGARRLAILQALETELLDEGLDVTAVECDVGNPDDCRTLISTAVSKYGTIDVLVNNAAISGVQKPSWEVSNAELDEVLRVNLFGALACMREAAPTMMANRSGSIVNISAFTGKWPTVNRLVYGTSKVALIGLTRTFALELAPFQVRCNLVSPGPVEGERVQEVISRASAAQNRTEDEIRETFLKWAPMGEIASEDEICDTVLFLASRGARHITGQDISVDGGIVMY